MTLLDGTTKTLTVGAIFDSKIFGDLAGRPGRRSTGSSNPVFDSLIVVKAATRQQDAAAASIETVVEQYPDGEVPDPRRVHRQPVEQIDGFLNFIYALLGMSMFIAMLGIVITLLLAVYERRRELGLMRAVGTTRPQVRGSMRWEAVMTALIGAIMGTALGLALGWIVVSALQDQGLDRSAAPLSIVDLRVVLSVVAGRDRRLDPRAAGSEGRHPLRDRDDLSRQPRSTPC